MIRGNNPEIDVLELMKRVRKEAATLRVNGSIEERRLGWQDDDDRRASRAVERHHYVTKLLAEYEAKNVPRSNWPKRMSFIGRTGPLGKLMLGMWNYFFKEQREKDAFVLQSLTELVAMSAQIGEYALRTRESMRSYINSRKALAEEFDAIRADAIAIQPLVARLPSLEGDLAHIHERIDTAERDLHALNDRLAGAATLADMSVHLAHSETAQLRAIDESASRALRADALIRAELTNLRDTVEASPNSRQPNNVDVSAPVRQTDALYLAIEDRFRGSRAEIEERLSVYVPLLRDSGTVSADTPLLDLGAGRGEFMHVLGKSGLPARGVDSNAIAVAEANLLNLDVAHGDLFVHLRRAPDASCGGVSAIHVIEHLPFDKLLELLQQSLRVLVPGGMLILETPNPSNVLVSTSTFYLDPTHRNPIPPAFASFIAQALGFAEVSILELHPREEAEGDAHGDPRLTRLLTAPQDYAVIARAPSA